MSNDMKVDGVCYCGEVTIKGTVSAEKIIACHFTVCQKLSGAPFRAVAVMSAEQVAISDPAKTLFKVRTGCLSQHDQLAPAKHIFGKSAASWLSTNEDQ